MSAPRSFGVDVHVDGDTAFLTPFGELDVATTPHLSDELAAVRGSCTSMVIDLGELAFIDSTGLRALLVEHRLAEAGGRQLVFRAGAPGIQRVFALTGLDEVLWFRDGASAADGDGASRSQPTDDPEARFNR